MPLQLTYPGVYVEEVPSAVHTITGVSTSITAFAGTAPRGPVGRVVECDSFAAYARAFGGLDPTSEMGYAVSQFFLNGGSNAQIIRVVGNPAPATLNLNASNGKTVLKVTSQFQGFAANGISVTVTPRSTADGLFNLVVQYKAPGDPSGNVPETFNGLSLDPTSGNYVESVINDPDTGSVLVRVQSQIPLDPTLLPSANGFGNLSSSSLLVPAKPAPALPDLTLLLLKGQDNLTLTINGYVVEVDGIIAGAGLQRGVNVAGQAELVRAYIQKVVTGSPAPLAGSTVFKSFKSGVANGVFTLTSGQSGADSEVTASGPAAAALRLGPSYGGTAVAAIAQLNPAAPPSTPQPLTGGNETPLDAVNDPSGYFTAYIGDPDLRTGLYGLEGVDLFNILCLPGMTDQAVPAAPAILAAAAAYCEARRAFLIVDSPRPPADLSGYPPPLMKMAVTTGPLMPKTDHGAVYYPWVKVPDPLQGGRSRLCAPCGTVAGIFARTDASRGVWKAPAGIEANLAGVVGLDYRMTDDQNGDLNPHGVNCLRTFPVYGNIVWGSRTLRGDDEFASDYKYVPVRRFALFLEESLYRGLKWAVFEPNDEPLWSSIRLNVGAFMHDLFVQGAFQGTSARDAYAVQCDATTTTQNDINRGTVNVIVSFAPLKLAEFVVLQIRQLAGQIQT